MMGISSDEPDEPLLLPTDALAFYDRTLTSRLITDARQALFAAEMHADEDMGNHYARVTALSTLAIAKLLSEGRG
jgi:hypothetical protein